MRFFYVLENIKNNEIKALSLYSIENIISPIKNRDGAYKIYYFYVKFNSELRKVRIGKN